jgi:carnitine 3-dehydrogenase
LKENKVITIVGTGVIGAGWAARFLAKGYTVKAYDPNSVSREQLKINVRTAFKSCILITVGRNCSWQEN